MLLIPLPPTHIPQPPQRGQGGGPLCPHLVAVSLTRTWLRREEQLNSNSSRKVTWGQGTWVMVDSPSWGTNRGTRAPVPPVP